MLGFIPHPFVDPALQPPFRVSDLPVGAWISPQAASQEAEWCKKLVHDADEIAGHRLSYFNLERHDMGNPIDWNRDHGSNRQAPMIYSPSIDYRDFRITGDCKLVWEPNRHHQLVVLGRAYRATGDKRYAQAVVDQLDSWLRQNPFGTGMNWRSPLELGIRLINWIWAIDLTRDAGLFVGDFRDRILHSVYLHCWENMRKLSRASSANNHLIGEAAGVFVATAYFQELPDAARWRNASREVLLREIGLQSYADGCTREHALGYEFFVLQFYLFCGIVAGKIHEDFPPFYWSRLERMLEFLGRLSEGGMPPPLFGDCDDGYVLNLGDSQHDLASLLSIGAILFNRPDFRARAGSCRETAHWLLGKACKEKFEAIPSSSSKENLESRSFPESGYYLLQSGEYGAPDRISVFFDCAELGFGPIAAHGHADALSFTLRAFGVEIFVDPGTYDYFTYPAWRNYFRSTRAHNCLVVDGKDQSDMLGPFMWGARAQARCTRWEPRRGGGLVSGEHDGYRGLADPVIHSRTLELDGSARTLAIHDEIRSHGTHAIAIYFHLSENCKSRLLQSNRIEISVAGRHVTLELDPRMQVETLAGSDAPIAGWVSRGYHRKVPATTIVARTDCNGSTTLVSRVQI
ncbi:MAG: heparinase II/III family protein [Gammaproteobacteria bacterium]|nr:heparinase II/III family protein [Gammaproteobacteria bacterium]